MTRDVSIILPAIRFNRWINLYNSITNSMKRSFELIIVGPTSLPPELQDKKNVKFVKDYGSPVRASQIASLIAEGKYLTWAADDCIFENGVLDKNLDLLDEKFLKNKNNKDVVINNYAEAGNSLPVDVLKLKVAYPPHTYISDDWYIFNVATMHTSFFYELGGYDCRFEACPFAHSDLAARAQRAGAIVHVINENMLTCGHMPGISGDHAPVHYAQTEHDEKLYSLIYENPNSQDRKNIDLDNWQNAPKIWDRRFKIGK